MYALSAGVKTKHKVKELRSLFLLPEICFTRPPFGLTLEGQYIVKNIFLVSAAFMIGGKVRAQ